MFGGKIVYVFMYLLKEGVVKIFLVGEWIVDFDEFEKVIMFRMKMIVFNIFYNLVGKVFFWFEFEKIVELCFKN